MKFNRKGKFVCVRSKYTWVTDQFMYYTSEKYADWVIIEFNHFFKFNKDTFKAYSGSSDTKSNTQFNPLDTQSISTTPINLN